MLTQSLALYSSWVSCPPRFHPLLFFAVSLLLALHHLSPSISMWETLIHAWLKQSLKTRVISLCHRTYFEEIILRGAVFTLRVRRRSELQRTRVDVEAAMFCGEGRRH